VAVYEHGPLTLAEVAKREGLSLSRIKQIEDKALKRLKKKKIFDF
jgi:DNA-directed RNA polymerase sigma subunit (sigma70/sigma32)